MSDFKPIRNKIRNFTFDSLTDEILSILKIFENDEKKRSFWHPLLLLKWNLEFSKKNYKAKVATKPEIGKLLKKIDELEMSHETFAIKKGENINKTFIILAQQQFFYQEITGWDSFSRQLILFKDLQSKYDINESFKNLTGLDLLTFISISYIIWVYSHQNETINIKYFGYLIDDIKEIISEVHKIVSLQSYLSLLTVSKDNVQDLLDEDNRVLRNHNLQSFEPSFFTRKPFFLYKNKYIIPHKDILHHHFNYFIYEFLKQKDDRFTTEFGLRMEKYVKLGLDETNIKYITETDLKKKLNSKDNLVDFIVSDNIMIEVKAIESKPYVSANPTDTILGNEFRKNLVKAYAKQMVNVANNINNNEEYFGIIITYKKLFLGSSEDMWEQFLKNETNKICTQEECKIIPHQNLFVMDIYTWDQTVQILKDNKELQLKDILIKVREDNKNPKTKKFHFSMHLDDYDFTNFDLAFLKEANKRIIPI